MKTISKLFTKIAFCAAVAATASASQAAPVTLENAGFEVNPQGQGYTYLGGQTVGGWTFGGNAGLAGNNSAFHVSNASGNQAAFLQTAGSSIAQTIDFGGGSLQLNFLAEFRSGYSGNTLYAMIGDQRLTFNGQDTFSSWSHDVFTAFSSDWISLAAGQYTVSFHGTSTPDYTTFIDDVTINAVPEPGSLALLMAGMLAVAGVARRRRG